MIWYSRSNVLWGCTWDSGAPGGALEARAHRWQVDGRSCARLGDRWRWVLAAGRGCWSPAAPALHAHAHKQGDMHTQSRLSHKEDVLGCAWHRSMLQAGNGMFPWGEGQKNDYMKKGGVFQPQMAGWVQKNKGLMVWTSVPGFKEEYICRFTRPVHTEMSNYFWIAVICRALDQSAAGLWPHIVLDLCLSMCVREVKKRRHGSILGSTLYIVPSGSGAHAAQPSCDLHASAAAWLCLSPAELFHSSSMARSSQGYACLTPLSHFSHASLWHIMEDARQFYCPWVKLHGNYCHMPRIHTHLQRGKVQILWSFHSFFSFPPVISLLIAYWSLSTNPQKPNRATKNPLLSFKCPLRLNVSFLLRPHSSQRHSSLPLFYFSLAVLNSCCWLSYSRDC